MEPPRKRRRNRGGRGRSRSKYIDRGRDADRSPYPRVEDTLARIERKLMYVKETSEHLEQVLEEMDDSLEAVLRGIRVRDNQPEGKWIATDIHNYDVELEKVIEQGLDNEKKDIGEYHEDEINWDEDDEEEQHLHCEHDHGYGSKDNMEDQEQEPVEVEQQEEEESDEDAYDPKAPFILDEHKSAFRDPNEEPQSSLQVHHEEHFYVSTPTPPPKTFQEPHYSSSRLHESNAVQDPHYSSTPPPQPVYSPAAQRAASHERIMTGIAARTEKVDADIRQMFSGSSKPNARATMEDCEGQIGKKMNDEGSLADDE